MKRTNFQNIAIVTFVAILFLIGGYLIFRESKDADTKIYTSERYGISFEYPEDYYLTEEVASSTDNGPSTIITITDKKYEKPENGEGPTAITVAMFDGIPEATSEIDPVEIWIKENPISNFHLSTMKTPGTTLIADQFAYLYTWDGLYRATTVVLPHMDNILMFSVTYDGETDMEKREAFTRMMESIRLTGGDDLNSTSTELGLGE